MPPDIPLRSETVSDSPSDESVSTAAIVESIRSAPAPVVNTQYLAEEYAVSTGELSELLFEMVDDGTLEHHRIQNGWHRWWLALETELDG